MNLQLRDHLLELSNKDLNLRDKLAQDGSLFDGYHPEMESLHKANAAELKKIIKEYGWPDKTLVGEDGVQAAWLVLQHDIGEPDFLRSVQPLLEQASNEGKIPKEQYAYFIDRINLFEGKPQKYGTQYDWDEDGQLSPSPIEDIEKVDELRASVGLLALEENTKRMREGVQKSGEKPPVNYLERKQKAEAWAKSVGWRS
ncbi:hypothetical protein KBC79_00885 [Candidatus Woesebacteria bacterium]|nr:hypothetical protein [Candidatus Woesebacteria bacterium]